MRHLPAGRWRFFISRGYKVQATPLQRRNPADVDKSGSLRPQVHMPISAIPGPALFC
jgi:hypothetical protein